MTLSYHNRILRLFPVFVISCGVGLPFLLTHSAKALQLPSAQENTVDQQSTELSPDNPFAQPSPLPFQAPPFDRIRTEHYLPAFQAGIRQQLAEIEAIANQTDEPTFENTIAAMEKTGALLNRVRAVFFNMTSSHTNKDLQNIQAEVAPLLAAHNDNILLNRRLFQRVETLYSKQDALNLTEEQQQVLKKHYEEFVRAGAKLTDEQQDRVRAINEQLSKLETKYDDLMLEVTRERSVVVTNLSDLDGLSDSEIAAAAEKAKERGKEGAWVLEISNTTRVPQLARLNNRSVRERLWKASANRALGENGGIDTRPLILEMIRLRTERANLLGFSTHAEYKLQDQMAKTPEAARKMLLDLIPGVIERVKQEAADLETMIRQCGNDHELKPWDWEYYAEKLRQERFQVDEADVRPFFEQDSVLDNGVFYTMNRLFGVTFRQRHDLPVYHPEVRVYDVIDHDGAQIGLFYIDFFKRDSKRGGAWMSSFVDQSKLLNRKPVIVNTLNNPRPAEGKPALLSFDNVTTMFHEMGHGVHGLFSDVTYPSVAGTATPRDFVEFPSTFQEDWAIQPDILANYARHYETGESIPADLLQKVIRSSRFNQGFDTLEYLSAAILDLEWHMLTEDQIPDDVEKFESQTLSRYGLDIPAVPPRYRSQYFTHIWSSGYEASYYAYIWSEVLAADAFAWMKANGGATRENGDRFRREILSRGGSRDPMKSYQAFRGKEPTVEALLIRRGLKSESPASE